MQFSQINIPKANDEDSKKMNFSYSWRRLDIACWMSERCCHVVSGGSGLVWLFTSGSRPPPLTFSESSSSITHTPGIASSPTTQSVIASICDVGNNAKSKSCSPHQFWSLSDRLHTLRPDQLCFCFISCYPTVSV